MKVAVVFLMCFVTYAIGTRDWERTGSSGSSGSRSGSPSRTGSGTGGVGGSGSGLSGSSRFGSSSGGGQCQWIRGHIKCADSNGKHDKNHVVVRLANGVSNTLDEGYTSQNGQFAVFGCSGSTFGTFKPELQVLHFCKSNRARRLRLPVPDGAGPEYNITSVIDLKAFYTEEQDYQDHIQLPCAA